MFRCLLKVEVWIQILIQYVWTSYTQSQNIAHFVAFPFLPFPQIYATCTRPIQQIISSYGLIGNYTSFKMIPNTTYIVLILKKYNRSKSSFLTLYAGNIFRWSLSCLFEEKKHYLCQYCMLQWSWDMHQVNKILVVISYKWTIMDNQCIIIHTTLS